MLISYSIVLGVLILLGIYKISFGKNRLYAVEKNKLVEFSYLPHPKSQTLLTKELQKFIENCLTKYSLNQKLPYYKKGLPFAYVYIFTDPISPQTTVASAHKIWKEENFDKVPTPFNLSRQANKTLTPTAMLKVTIQCIITDHTRTWWDYQGYFLSLLIDNDSGIIWDARGGITDIDV